MRDGRCSLGTNFILRQARFKFWVKTKKWKYGFICLEGRSCWVVLQCPRLNTFLNEQKSIQKTHRLRILKSAAVLRERPIRWSITGLACIIRRTATPAVRRARTGTNCSPSPLRPPHRILMTDLFLISMLRSSPSLWSGAT